VVILSQAGLLENEAMCGEVVQQWRGRRGGWHAGGALQVCQQARGQGWGCVIWWGGTTRKMPVHGEVVLDTGSGDLTTVSKPLNSVFDRDPAQI